jgi:hypothetical protein
MRAVAVVRTAVYGRLRLSPFVFSTLLQTKRPLMRYTCLFHTRT